MNYFKVDLMSYVRAITQNVMYSVKKVLVYADSSAIFFNPKMLG